MKPEDFKQLAGPWRGTSRGQAEAAQPIEGFIYENGSFYIAPRGTLAAQVPGQMRVVDGAVLYAMPTSTGTMTFEEAGSEWVGGGRVRLESETVP